MMSSTQFLSGIDNTMNDHYTNEGVLDGIDGLVRIYAQMKIREQVCKTFLDKDCPCELCSRWKKQIADLHVQMKQYEATINGLHKKYKERLINGPGQGS